MVDFEKQNGIKLKGEFFSDREATFGALLFIVIQLILLYLARFLVSMGVGLTGLFNQLFTVVIELGFVLAVFIISKMNKKDFVKSVGLNKKVNGKIVLICFFICLLCLFGLSRISEVFLTVLNALGYHSSASSIEVNTVWDLLIYAFTVALVPAVCEEIMFRGLILNGLSRLGKHFAVIISAVLFTLMHGSPDQTVHQFILGLVFGYIVYFSGNIWISMIIHFFNNFIVLFISFVLNLINSGEASEIAATSNVLVIIVSTAISIAIVIIAIMLIVAEIKNVSKLSNNLNSEPEYLTEEDKAWLEKVNGQERPAEVNNEIEIEEFENPIYKKEPEKPQKLSKQALIYLLISVCYLGIDWVIALINGFVS